MKIVCWNMRRATTTAVEAWRYFLELEPDVALLQEVVSIPDEVSSQYTIRIKNAQSKSGGDQKFGTAVFAKGKLGDALDLQTEWKWVNRELDRFKGNLLSYDLEPDDDRQCRVLSVYSPPWPIDRERLAGVDTSSLKLVTNPDVWVTELMWAALRCFEVDDVPWIVGGDLNSSITFDYMWGKKPRGNQEIQDRMKSLGFLECLSAHQGELTPTFRNPKGGKVIHQMDYLFVSGALRDRLESCVVGDPDRVFGGSLSDHLPIIARFRK